LFWNQGATVNHINLQGATTSDFGVVKPDGTTIIASGGVLSATAQSTSMPLFGDGSDGNVTVSTAITLSRDMYYNNLTLSGSAAINTVGYRIYVAGTLDISAAPAGSIKANAGAGSTMNGSNGNVGGAGAFADGSSTGAAPANTLGGGDYN